MRVVIAGGGIGALASYIGMFKKFRENPGSKLLFSKFEWIGSSAGAIALCIYAADRLDTFDEEKLLSCSDDLENAINIINCVENNASGLIGRENLRSIINQFVSDADDLKMSDIQESCGTRVSFVTSRLCLNGESGPILRDEDLVIDCLLDSISVPGLVEPRMDEGGTIYVDGDLTCMDLLKSDDILISMKLFQMPAGDIALFNVLFSTLNHIYKKIKHKELPCPHINIGICGTLFLYSIEHTQEFLIAGEKKGIELFSRLMSYTN